MFSILEDIGFIAIGFVGAFTLIKFKPEIANLISKKVSDAEDTASTIVAKAQEDKSS